MDGWISRWGILYDVCSLTTWRDCSGLDGVCALWVLLLKSLLFWTRRAFGGAHEPPTKLFPRLAVNKTVLKPRDASLQRRAPNTYAWDFPDVIKFRVAAHTISQKTIRFRHPDYNPDRAQRLISSSMSRHLSTRNISSKSMHAILSRLILQIDRQTNAGKRIYLLLCRR